jgi:Zn-dependent protease/CBS domain-containing protein
MKETSLVVFRLGGIPVRLHFTFPIILVIVALQYGVLSGFNPLAILNGIFITFLLFVLVLIHEFAHGLAARRYGIGVKEIILFPLGGMATLEAEPRESKQEIVIAAAGPAANLILAGWLLVAGFLGELYLGLDLRLSIQFDYLALNPGEVLGYLVLANLVLAIFNLIPSFPLDGARILRALLGTRFEFESATRLAGTLGQMTAAMIGVWALMQGAFLLVPIAVFLFLASRQTEMESGFHEQVSAVTVEQIINRDYIPLEGYSTIREAVDLVRSSNQRATPITEYNFYLGMLTQKRLVKAVKEDPPYRFALNFIRTDIETASLTDRVVDISSRLSADDVDALPVVENGKYLGVVTISDVNRVLRLKFKKDPAVREAG